MPAYKKLVFCGVWIITYACLSGCTVVQPWERGNLARSDMAWQPDSLKATIDSHIYHSKEAASGGAFAAGGGCGCN